MKILFVTTAYPPFFDMQTIRNIKLINKLIDLGHDITVLSPNAEWMSSKNEIFINRKVNVWNTPPPPLIKIQHFLSKHKYLVLFLNIFNILVNYLPIPDIFVGWSIVVKDKIFDQISRNSFDLVLTSSGGYSAHYIGSRINKKYNIPWAADYGDPWGLDIYGNKKGLSFYIENKLLKNCSGLFFTTESTIYAYKKQYNLQNIPVFYLPCGFDKNEINLNNELKGDYLNIVYTGVAYSLSRNLSNAVIAVSKLKSLNVIFEIVGSYSKKFVKLSETLGATNIKFRGKVSYNESLDIINKADVLLHIGNYGYLQIPGKTYIYLGTPKPIIYIKQEKSNDPTLDLMSKFEGVFITDNNPKEIEIVIKDIYKNYNFYLEKSIYRLNSDILYNFTWDNIGVYFNECLNQILKNKD